MLIFCQKIISTAGHPVFTSKQNIKSYIIIKPYDKKIYTLKYMALDLNFNQFESWDNFQIRNLFPRKHFAYYLHVRYNAIPGSR